MQFGLVSAGLCFVSCAFAWWNHNFSWEQLKTPLPPGIKAQWLPNYQNWSHIHRALGFSDCTRAHLQKTDANPGQFDLNTWFIRQVNIFSTKWNIQRNEHREILTLSGSNGWSRKISWQVRKIQMRYNAWMYIWQQKNRVTLFYLNGLPIDLVLSAQKLPIRPQLHRRCPCRCMAGCTGRGRAPYANCHWLFCNVLDSCLNQIAQ